MRILKYFYIFIGLIALLGCSARPARAQFLGYTSPQTVQATPLSAVTSPTTVNLTNLGQNVHYLSYTVSGVISLLDIRLEASINGSTFFSISEDATDFGTFATGSGAVYAIGYYPIIRVNLVAIAGGGNITATYTGTSSTSGSPLGSYNPSQSVRRVVFSNLPANVNQTAVITAPFASTLGYILLTTTAGGAMPAGSTLSVTNSIGNTGVSIPLNQSLSTAATQAMAVAAAPTTNVTVSYVSGGASAQNLNVWYVFVNPSEPTGISWPTTQPLAALNTESTSAANTAVSKVIAALFNQRAHLFTVSARCSAGTAQIIVLDGATQIWSSAATEVSTTTFRFQWNPSLSNTLGNSMTVTLGTCGAANTGTLDVQASQF